ncbi:MAG: site-specific integrase [Bacteroidales bacterium]|nr:site-specific integrase [Bacteroidales bacterium]
MARSYLKLDVRRPLKDGSYPVVLAVGYGRNMYLGTGISCEILDWDDATRQCTGTNAFAKNATLKSLLETIQQKILRLREDGRFNELNNKDLRAILEEKPQHKKSKPTLESVFQTVIGLKHGRTADLYRETLKKVNGYCPNGGTYFEDINRLWLDQFVQYLSHLSVNTRAIHLRNLKAVIHYAMDCEIPVNMAIRRFSIPTEATRKRNLSIDTLRKLATAELPEHLKKYRDFFMLSFYLMGINVVDLCYLIEVKDGRVEYQRAKTKKRYSVKVWPEAQAIIDKYRGKSHLLNMLDTNKEYRTFYQQYGHALRQIAKILGIPELTSYYARHL